MAGKLGGDRSLARGAEGQLGRRTPQHKQRRRAQGERVAIGNVKSAGQSRRKFVLGDGAYPVGGKVAAVVGEILRKGISENGPRGIIGGVIAQAQQRSVAQAIGEASQLKIALADAPRNGNFLVVRAFQIGSAGDQRNPRPRFAEIGRSAVESLFRTQIRRQGGVAIFHHGVGREMKIERAKRTQRRSPAEKLDGLVFAAILQLGKIGQAGLVGEGHRQGLQWSAVIVYALGGKAAHGNGNFRTLAAGKLVGVGGAQDRRLVKTGADMTAKRKRPGREQ